MQILEHQFGDVRVLQAGPRLDVAATPAFKQAVQRVFAGGGGQLVLDLSRTGYVSSVGVGVCLEAARLAQSAGGRVALAGLADAVAEVFRLTGVDRLFEVYPTVDEAVHSFDQGSELGLAEELLLLALRDRRGQLVDVTAATLERAVLGAALIDLCQRGRLEGDRRGVRLLDAGPLGDSVLDPLLADVAANEGGRDAAAWLVTLAEEAPELCRRALVRLVELGVLLRPQGAVEWAPGERRYALGDDRAHRLVRQRVFDLIRSDAIPGPRDVALVALADACAIFDATLDQDEVFEAGPRIAAIARLDPLAAALSAALRAASEEEEAATGGDWDDD